MDILTAIRGANLSKFSGRRCQLNRARILKAYPPTRQIGEALASCPNPNGVPPGEKVGPYKKDELCGLLYCQTCRDEYQSRAKNEALRLFLGRDEEGLRKLTINIVTLPLDIAPKALQSRLRRERDKLRKAIARAPGGRSVVLYGVFEITPVLAEKCISDTCPIESYHDVMLQLHIHSWIHLGDISEGQFSKLIRKSYWSKYNRRTQVMKRKGVCVHSLGIDIEDWAGYVNKVSMKMAIGKNNGVGLQKYVERMEFIRGNGLRGLTMRYGTRRSKVL